MNNVYNNNNNQMNNNNSNQMNNLSEISYNNRNNNYHNIQNQVDNNIFQNNNHTTNLVCPFPCLFCNNSPISEIVFYCPNCNNVFCKRCELKEGPKHNHSYYQIKNNSQYNYLHLNEKIKLKNLINDFGNKVQGAYNNVVNFLRNDNNINNDMNNNRNNNNYMGNNNNELYLINIARNSYDLRNISDQQIKEALRKTNGNIDSAVILLTLNNNNV